MGSRRSRFSGRGGGDGWSTEKEEVGMRQRDCEALLEEEVEVKVGGSMPQTSCRWSAAREPFPGGPGGGAGGSLIVTALGRIVAGVS